MNTKGLTNPGNRLDFNPVALRTGSLILSFLSLTITIIPIHTISRNTSSKRIPRRIYKTRQKADKVMLTQDLVLDIGNGTTYREFKVACQIYCQRRHANGEEGD